MGSNEAIDTRRRLLEAAFYFGASLAGLVPAEGIRDSPSRRAWKGSLPSLSRGTILVVALEHSPTNPALDWWDGPSGGTPGNRQLLDISGRTAEWLKTTRAIETHDLAYAPQKDGIFLKDAAVLAGLGTIGKNNLLITPRFGPRIRLRSLLIDYDLPASPALDFDPCDGCDMPCHRVCPKTAFASGSFCRDSCLAKMDDDESEAMLSAEAGDKQMVIAYCRECELACPIGRDDRQYG